MEDARTTAARTHFDRWSEGYERGRGAGRLQQLQTSALVCTTAFHHFPKPLDTIAEMSRVLAPGGRLVIADARKAP